MGAMPDYMPGIYIDNTHDDIVIRYFCVTVKVGF